MFYLVPLVILLTRLSFSLQQECEQHTADSVADYLLAGMVLEHLDSAPLPDKYSAEGNIQLLKGSIIGLKSLKRVDSLGFDMGDGVITAQFHVWFDKLKVIYEEFKVEGQGVQKWQSETPGHIIKIKASVHGYKLCEPEIHELRVNYLNDFTKELQTMCQLCQNDNQMDEVLKKLREELTDEVKRRLIPLVQSVVSSNTKNQVCNK